MIINQNNNEIVSKYLLDKFDLWLWDWDDTLIDTTTYYVKSMEPEDIINRSQRELDIEVPNWRYFKKLINELVLSGKRVGIVSFGTYKIIRAYMDLIFGFNQKLFTSNNIIALCRDHKGQPIEYYPNKNDFIDRVMNLYNLNDYQKVVLFDDRMTNVSDAKKKCIYGVKIIGKDDNTLTKIKTLQDAKKYYEKTLFSHLTIKNLEKEIKLKESRNNILCNTSGTLGSRKFLAISNTQLNNNLINKEELLNQDLDSTIIDFPTDNELFNNQNLKKNKSISNRNQINQLNYNSLERTQEDTNTNTNIEGFSNYNTFNNIKINNLNNNLSYNLNRHKKIFLLLFIISLLICIFYLKNKKGK